MKSVIGGLFWVYFGLDLVLFWVYFGSILTHPSPREQVLSLLLRDLQFVDNAHNAPAERKVRK